MDWKSYPQERPEESQPYLVSINRPYVNNDLTFNYVAYYNAETNQWHKYDGFDDNGIRELITNRVVGWTNLTTYLG